MELKPKPGQVLRIDGMAYEFVPNPKVLDRAFAQTGRKAKVYQILNQHTKSKAALKIFYPGFRKVEIANSALSLSEYNKLPGLRVATRSVLKKGKKDDVDKYQELEHAVLMEWIFGPTWENVIQERIVITEKESLQLAIRLSFVLASLETNGLAHCDIAGANVIVRPQEGLLELVDIEDMFGPIPRFSRPEHPVSGREGYNFQGINHSDPWVPEADRFAGALLLTEMLIWHDAPVRELSNDISFFMQDELGQESDRFRAVVDCLRGKYGEGMVRAFHKAWFAKALNECPSLTDWYELIHYYAGITPTPIVPIEFNRAEKEQVELDDWLDSGGDKTGLGSGSEIVESLKRLLQRSGRIEFPFKPGELALLVVGLPLIAIILIWSLSPSLVRLPEIAQFWGDLPIISIVPPLIYAAYKSIKWTLLGYAITTIFAGLIERMQVSTLRASSVVSLLAGVAASAIVMGLLIWLSSRFTDHGENSRRGMLVMAITTTVGTLILYLVSLGYVPNFIWLAPLLGAIGWLIGEFIFRKFIDRRERPKLSK